MQGAFRYWLMSGELLRSLTSLRTPGSGSRPKRRVMSLAEVWTFLVHAGSQIGGRCGIRTHEELAPLPVFKTGAFNRSANLPDLKFDGLHGRYFTTRCPCSLKPACGQVDVSGWRREPPQKEACGEPVATRLAPAPSVLVFSRPGTRPIAWIRNEVSPPNCIAAASAKPRLPAAFRGRYSATEARPRPLAVAAFASSSAEGLMPSR